MSAHRDPTADLAIRRADRQRQEAVPTTTRPLVREFPGIFGDLDDVEAWGVATLALRAADGQVSAITEEQLREARAVVLRLAESI